MQLPSCYGLGFALIRIVIYCIYVCIGSIFISTEIFGKSVKFMHTYMDIAKVRNMNIKNKNNNNICNKLIFKSLANGDVRDNWETSSRDAFYLTKGFHGVFPISLCCIYTQSRRRNLHILDFCVVQINKIIFNLPDDLFVIVLINKCQQQQQQQK